MYIGLVDVTLGGTSEVQILSLGLRIKVPSYLYAPSTNPPNPWPYITPLYALN